MKKTLKTALLILLAVVILGGGVTGFLLWRHSQIYIGATAAKAVALADAGFNTAQVYELHADFEKEHGSAYYDVEFTAAQTEYDYVVDAVSGAVLSSWTEDAYRD